ncbi:hypothetical protein LTR86_005918 [Recurvomyces mirabilis]|nr:hypothetical protein LTR86_005918 [Recurvomyces mirabilis]
MDTITTIREATSDILSQVYIFLPNILKFVFSPTVAVLCWLGLVQLFRKTKPINNAFGLLRMPLYKGNKCDEIWILSGILGVYLHVLWLATTALEPGLTPPFFDRHNADERVMPWTVKVFTSMIVYSSMMATISATASASREHLTEIFNSIPELVYATLYAFCPPNLSIGCWCLVVSLLLSLKPIYSIFTLLGAQLTNQNCDNLWPRVAVLAIIVRIIWLSYLLMDRNHTPSRGREAKPSVPRTTWSVEVYTSTVVCIVVSQSTAAVTGIIMAFYEVWSQHGAMEA